MGEPTMFQEGLYTFITQQPAFQSLLGTSRGDKTTGLFQMLAVPQATLPYIVYSRVSRSEASSLQGANALQTGRFRFSCYAASQRTCVILAEAIQLLFANWTGTFPDGTVVQNVYLENETEDAESVGKGTIYGSHIDLSFVYIDNASGFNIVDVGDDSQLVLDGGDF